MHINDAKHLALGGVGQINDLEVTANLQPTLNDGRYAVFAGNTHISDDAIPYYSLTLKQRNDAEFDFWSP